MYTGELSPGIFTDPEADLGLPHFGEEETEARGLASCLGMWGRMKLGPAKVSGTSVVLSALHHRVSTVAQW